MVKPRANKFIMGVDQSYAKTGIVVFEVIDDYLKMRHAEIYKTKKEEGCKVVRAAMVGKRLTALCKEWKVKHVMMENLAFAARGNVTRDLAGLLFVICDHIMVRKRININLVSPSQLKKLATGRGRAEKYQMIEALPKVVLAKFVELGFKKTTGMEDAADAYHLGQCYLKLKA